MVNESYFANPSSIHELGGETERLLEAARKQVSEHFRVNEDEIIFTSGGTEGNNLAIQGIAFQYGSRGKHIITTEIEHPSVYETCKKLEQQGFSVTYLPVNDSGLICLDTLESVLTEETILVSITHVNSETGVIQNIPEIAKLLKKYHKAFFHVDHVQGLGKVPLFPREVSIDLCTTSGHKIHGLKGTGALYVRKGVQLHPLFYGGNQENGFRAGTENVAGAVSFARAVRLIQNRYQNDYQRLLNLGRKLVHGLEKIDGVSLNTKPQVSAGHIVNFSVKGLKPEVIIHALGAKKIYISTKSACSSRNEEASRIILACFNDEERAKSALRVSLSYENTEEEINVFLSELEVAIRHLQNVLE